MTCRVVISNLTLLEKLYNGIPIFSFMIWEIFNPIEDSIFCFKVGSCLAP